MTLPAKILVCDDHPVILLALRSELARAGFALAEPATSISDAARALDDPEFRLVITDFSFHEPGDGLQWIARLHRLRPDVGIIVYSMITSPPMVQDILGAGARAFVSKTCGMADVIAACQAVLLGLPFIAPPELADRAQPTGKLEARMSQARLSPREREVLRLLAQGLSIIEIGRHFNRSPKTVSVQKCTAMRKLGLQRDMELASYLTSAEWTDGQEAENLEDESEQGD